MVNISNNLKNTYNKIKRVVVRKDPTMMYAIVGFIAIGIVSVFVYLYFTGFFTSSAETIIQTNDIDGRIGFVYNNPLKLSKPSRPYSCTFCFWLYLRSMSNMQETETNYILSYDMETIEGVNTPYLNVIYGDVDDTKLNQITVTFKNMEDTSEHIVVKDIELQKWLCIQIVMRDVIVDFYMNGELVKSKTLGYVPILSNKGTLTVGKENGFNGIMTNLTYYNYNLDDTELNKYYTKGSS